ncbi:MAG: hypothetical protein LZF60_360009 [Nitrospira sp.]|nr:MAG: hypothetical protein LZF60_360009 [Nitrospira sp.]
MPDHRPPPCPRGESWDQDDGRRPRPDDRRSVGSHEAPLGRQLLGCITVALAERLNPLQARVCDSLPRRMWSDRGASAPFNPDRPALSGCRTLSWLQVWHDSAAN